MNKNLGILEGLLYVEGDNGLTIKELMEILTITQEEAISLIQTLKQRYEQEDHGLRIKYLGNCFKLTTKEEHKEYYQKIIEEDNHPLSNAALETLAIIAYNEPITRLEIDKLRGLDTNYTLRKLLARGLIKESGKSTLPGRPILYKTTDDFLDYFGLSNLSELPKPKDIQSDTSCEDLFLSKYKEESE